WETQVHDYRAGNRHSSGFIAVDGKVFSGRSCQDRCFIAAHDIETGEELWRTYTTALPGEPGGDTWGDLPAESRIHVSPWGMPGAYDPERNLLYWGIAVPLPYSRVVRHGADAANLPEGRLCKLYSKSTVDLNADTGEMEWYYQHLPCDDWDADHVQARLLITTEMNPNPEFIKWINP